MWIVILAVLLFLILATGNDYEFYATDNGALSHLKRFPDDLYLVGDKSKYLRPWDYYAYNPFTPDSLDGAYTRFQHPFYYYM